ncbi:hypothetical protein, partial [Pseudomonas sp. 2822-17]|uniref:hypothetical protein n=1 Tax=Pseudomonas sp. 2822-17 TaxID=1712678 RepID=UPI0013040CAD
YFEIGGKRRTEGLYLSDVDGRNRTKIATPYKKEFKGINIIGSWIYYYDLHGLYRTHIKTHTTEKID